jgi:hypothetical protein
MIDMISASYFFEFEFWSKDEEGKASRLNGTPSTRKSSREG